MTPTRDRAADVAAMPTDARRKMLEIEAPQADPQTVTPDHSGLAAKRVLAGVLGGVVVAGIALGEGASWSVAALGATDVAALVFVAWVWISVVGSDAGATARLARAEDASRAAAEAVLLGAGAASLPAVGFTLAQASHAHASARGLLTTLALTSVALAWAAVHTVYALRYASLCYTPPDGGIDFKGRASRLRRLRLPRRDDRMTFQVSDADLTGKRIRRQALRHALTSYVFGTVIVTITVSSVASPARPIAAGRSPGRRFGRDRCCGDGGIVTLRGTVERFSQRLAAEHDAMPAASRASYRSSTT
jgi:uncharacterized membrane protein